LNPSPQFTLSVADNDQGTTTLSGTTVIALGNSSPVVGASLQEPGDAGTITNGAGPGGTLTVGTGNAITGGSILLANGDTLTLSNGTLTNGSLTGGSVTSATISFRDSYITGGAPTNLAR